MFRGMRIYLPHHCRSQGKPSLSPSISTPGQLPRKKAASSQDVICEQWMRPSHLNDADCGGATTSGFETGVVESENADAAERGRTCW